jgi:hypothetical protein
MFDVVETAVSRFQGRKLVDVAVAVEDYGSPVGGNPKASPDLSVGKCGHVEPRSRIAIVGPPRTPNVS